MGVNNMTDKNSLWDFLIDHNIATEQELSLVTDINGFSESALEEVLYARTGYRDLAQYVEAELDEFYGIESEEK